METLFRSPQHTPDRTLRAPGATRLRRGVAVLAAAVVLPLTSACAANFSAPTQQLYQPGIGTDDRNGTVYALNMFVVADGSGNGTVVGTLLNQDGCPDYVVDLRVIDADGGGVDTSTLPIPESLTPTQNTQTGGNCPTGAAPSQGITLPSQQPVKFPEDAQVRVSADTVTPGTFVTLTLRFERAEQLELDLPVVALSDLYPDVTVGPIERTQ